MKKIIAAAIIASTALSSVSAFAADNNDYFVQFNTGFVQGLSSNGDFSKGDMGDTSLFGIEAGYKLNKNLRMSASFDYLPSFSNTNTSTLDNGLDKSTSIKVKSYVSMLNLYYDIGQFNKLVPYATIGAGIAKNRTGLSTTDYGSGVVTVDSSRTTTNFAYKLGLGTKYIINESFDMDLRYQYSDYGSYRTGVTEKTYEDGMLVEVKSSAADKGSLSSHQVLLGVSYKF